MYLMSSPVNARRIIDSTARLEQHIRKTRAGSLSESSSTALE